MQNMQNHIPICRICNKQKMQNMLYMQNMQNNMYKICNKYADKYAEYVHKYAKKKAEYAKYAKLFSRYAEYVQNQDLQNMLYMQNMQQICK